MKSLKIIGTSFDLELNYNDKAQLIEPFVIIGFTKSRHFIQVNFNQASDISLFRLGLLPAHISWMKKFIKRNKRSLNKFWDKGELDCLDFRE